MSGRQHTVDIGPIPSWMDAPRLLGEGTWEQVSEGQWRASLSTAQAADVAARLRGLGFGGVAVNVRVAPPLHRNAVRDARTIDARRRRDTTPLSTARGLRMDEEGRMSWTPEALADAFAKAFFAPRVIDLGCGAGALSIAFARAGSKVTAVESNLERIKDASVNARIYGVSEHIEFVAGDAFDWVARDGFDALLLDPPWGADWNRTCTTIDSMPLLSAALQAFEARRVPRVVAKLPPSFDACTLEPARIVPFFGQAPGDFRRVKFIGVEWNARASEATSTSTASTP